MTVAKTYGLKVCANSSCTNDFEAHRVNMIFCSPECCREATNQKLIAKYHQKKAESKLIKHCKCGTRISKYNRGDTCNACILHEENKKRQETLARLGISYIVE